MYGSTQPETYIPLVSKFDLFEKAEICYSQNKNIYWFPPLLPPKIKKKKFSHRLNFNVLLIYFMNKMSGFTLKCSEHTKRIHQIFFNFCKTLYHAMSYILLSALYIIYSYLKLSNIMPMYFKLLWILNLKTNSKYKVNYDPDSINLFTLVISD